MRVVYTIDAADRIAHANDDWTSFARDNGGAHLVAESVVGRSLWELVRDTTMQALYVGIIRRVRAGAVPVQFAFRCDAPDARRLLQMKIAGHRAGAVEFEVTPLAVEPHPPLPHLESRNDQPGVAYVTACSWCKRVEVPSGWIEADQVFRPEERPLEISHGICRTCYDTYLRVLNEDSPSEAFGDWRADRG